MLKTKKIWKSPKITSYGDVKQITADITKKGGGNETLIINGTPYGKIPGSQIV